jgi:hypothetical protein
MGTNTKRLYLRVPPELLDELDAWHAAQSDASSRSKCVRHVLRPGLAASKGGLTDRLLNLPKREFQRLRATLNEFEPLPE